MQKEILSGPIQETIPAGRFLIGRRGFHFEEDNGANGGGAPSQGGQQGNQGQQQQQQQQQVEPPDPFKDIDLDLLDPATRQAIEQSRTSLKDLHGRARQASTYQSEADKLKQQQAELESRLQRLQSGQQQQQQQQQRREPTFEESIVEVLMGEGMNEATARQTAKIQSKIFERFGGQMEAKIGQRFAPVVGQVLSSNMTEAFETARTNDIHGIMQIDAVAERVWQQVQQLGANGSFVDPEVALNFAKIYYMDYLQEGGQPVMPGQSSPPQFQQQQRMQQQQQQNGQHQGTRYTFPGAGAHARLPINPQNQSEAADPETMAAVNATMGNWPVKPKGYNGGDTRRGKVFVTRNGR